MPEKLPPRFSVLSGMRPPYWPGKDSGADGKSAYTFAAPAISASYFARCFQLHVAEIDREAPASLHHADVVNAYEVSTFRSTGVFDLDGTLAESKSALSPEMA